MMNKFALTLLASLATLLFSTVLAQQDTTLTSSQAIAINPIASNDYTVEVYVDKDPTGKSSPSYIIGETISMNVGTNQDSYVYLFNIRSDGTVEQLIPNRFDNAGSDNYVRANTIKPFPPNGASYSLSVDGPTGLEKVIVVASKTQLDVSELANFSADPNFASSQIGEEGFANTLSIIVQPIAPKDWITDTALFHVVTATPPLGLPTPVAGTVFVTANVNNAAVFINDIFQGNTIAGQVSSFSGPIGVNRVRISAPGYHDFEKIIVVDGRTDITATLTPITGQDPPTPQLPTPVGGTVFVTANVSNAAVYLDDVFQGYTIAGQALSFSTSFGVKQVRVSAPGYHEFDQIIHPFDGRTDVTATLIPLVRQVTVDLEAGPIWNQSDAQNKCSALARQYSGSWTGAWLTTVQDEMSVCNVTITTPITVNLEAGPIWNQNDAQNKCPTLASSLGGTWNGNWITTVQGAMSVCSIDF